MYYGGPECDMFGSQLVLKLDSQLDSQVRSSIRRPEARFGDLNSLCRFTNWLKTLPNFARAPWGEQANHALQM